LPATPTSGLSHGAQRFFPFLPIQPGWVLIPVMMWVGRRCETQTTGLKRSCGSIRVADNSPLAVGYCLATALYVAASVLVMPFFSLIAKLMSMKAFREFVKMEISDAYAGTTDWRKRPSLKKGRKMSEALLTRA
jgi:hypothetical protein